MLDEEDRILKAARCKDFVRAQLLSPKDVLIKRDLALALEQARLIVDAARTEAQGIRQQARQEGLAEGLRETVAILKQAEEQRLEVLRRSQEEMLPLTLAIARKVIGAAIELDRELMTRLVEQALRQVSAARRVSVRVPPPVASDGPGARQRFLDSSGAAQVSVIVDESLLPGDCIIETEIGRIDARIDVQLEHILAALGRLEDR